MSKLTYDDKIKLYNDRIEIYLNSPIKKGSDSQDFSFYFTAIYNFEIEIYV